VQAFGELLLLVGVAASAIDGRQFIHVRELLGVDVGVAVIAFERCVGGGAEGSGIEGRWDSSLPFGSSAAGIVTGHAFRGSRQFFRCLSVFRRLRAQGRREQRREKQGTRGLK